jgi:hypothetical protein
LDLIQDSVQKEKVVDSISRESIWIILHEHDLKLVLVARLVVLQVE